MKPLDAFPTTRYLGSKRKLLPALKAVFETLEFFVAADPFCGSGAVSYLLKSLNCQVLASDAMQWNTCCTSALLDNDTTAFLPTLNNALAQLPVASAPEGFIEKQFDGLFFLRSENRFLDQFRSVCGRWPGPLKNSAFFALFQAALAKRPYNLFHRANLYMRQQEVKRSFGNKTTWDTPFEVLIRRYAEELQLARFASPKKITVQQQTAEEADFSTADLVYLDPPYVSANGSSVDYQDYYHFLEGISLEDDARWEERLLHRYRHKPLADRGTSPWSKADKITGAFKNIIKKCEHAHIVISYRCDGIPGIDELAEMLKKSGKRVRIEDCGQYVYALSKNTKSREVIIVGS
ncbi:MAG: DNA adenine methylase [Deltaproteobacteria bacterium]|nr:DNA adenine methylase [Deltaproteobacteria bacterium]